MSTLPSSFDAMLAAWNERDPEKIRSHLDAALAPDVVFADPDNYTVGVDAFEDMVRRFREKWPNAKSERTSGFDTHHNRYRYHWLVTVAEGQALPGMDVAEIDDQGRVVRVDGFFGPIPRL